MRRQTPFLVLGALGLLAGGIAVGRLGLWHQQAAPTGRPNPRSQAVDPTSPSAPAAADGKQAIRLPVSLQETLGLRDAAAEIRAIQETLTLPGTIVSHPERTVAVGARVEGKIVAARGLPGDAVAVGEVLAEVRSVELERLQTDLLQAWSRLDLAVADRDLARELLARKAIAAKEVVRKEMEQRQADREAEALKARLRLVGMTDREIEQLRAAAATSSLLAIRAPIAGVIVERNAVVGEVATPEKTLFRLADLRQVLAEGEAFESQAPRLRRGLPVRVLAGAVPGRHFTGRVSHVAPVVDPDRRTLRVWAEIDNSPDASLRPNMYAQLLVVLSERSKALAIPVDALLSGDGEEAVFVRVGGGYERRPVAVGLRDDRYAEVKAGLAPGDRVVVTGKQQLEAMYERATARMRGESSPTEPDAGRD